MKESHLKILGMQVLINRITISITYLTFFFLFVFNLFYMDTASFKSLCTTAFYGIGWILFGILSSPLNTQEIYDDKENKTTSNRA